MIVRAVLPLVRERLAPFPAVTIVGPRQCGKTTLARTLAQDYFNLEAPEERTRLDATWHAVMETEGPIVFDEAQYWPELFRRLRGEIDSRRKLNGRLLLGSIAPSLMRDVGESLAGRMVAEMVEADRQTLLCRVREAVVGDRCTVTNLEDYLGAQSRS
jgi:uncharacterized protein